MMEEEPKKVSFGFSRHKKQSNLVKPVEITKREIEYVDSFDCIKGQFSYKGNIRSDKPEKPELVIPLIGTKSVLEVIKAKLDEKNARNCSDISDTVNGGKTSINDREVSNVTADANQKIKNDVKKIFSIDELAAKEILNDLKSNSSNEKTSDMVIKQPSAVLEEKEIPIDYENIPVSDFGLAMLRGMGWTPQTGIGKEQKVVPVVTPKLRPKGLGLGADKAMTQKSSENEDFTLSVKSYVKFVNGTLKGNYGQVEAMDDDSGRVVVKLSLGEVTSVSEVMLVAISKKEYDENCKVINSRKYDSYREPQGSRQADSKVMNSTPERKERKDENRIHRKEKYNRRDQQEMRNSKKLIKIDSDVRRKNKDHSESSESERESHRKKKHKRDRSREHRRKRRKKEKKRKYSSESDSRSSADVGSPGNCTPNSKKRH